MNMQYYIIIHRPYMPARRYHRTVEDTYTTQVLKTTFPSRIDAKAWVKENAKAGNKYTILRHLLTYTAEQPAPTLIISEVSPVESHD